MDDDYFIVKPSEKSDLFYEENGKVHPYLFVNEYMPFNKTRLLQILSKLLKNVDDKDIKISNTTNGNNYIIYYSRLLLYYIFEKDIKRAGFPLIQVSFTHNAVSLYCKSTKEIYYYVKERNEYANLALNSTFRNVRGIL